MSAMTEYQIYMLCCLVVLALLCAYILKLTINSEKAEAKRSAEASAKRQAYEKAQAQKKLWDSNFAESEKLFEKGGAKK